MTIPKPTKSQAQKMIELDMLLAAWMRRTDIFQQLSSYCLNHVYRHQEIGEIFNRILFDRHEMSALGSLKCENIITRVHKELDLSPEFITGVLEDIFRWGPKERAIHPDEVTAESQLGELFTDPDANNKTPYSTNGAAVATVPSPVVPVAAPAVVKRQAPPAAQKPAVKTENAALATARAALLANKPKTVAAPAALTRILDDSYPDPE